MIKDGQVRTLRKLLADGRSLAVAARRTGMDEKTARKYREADKLPSQMKPERGWRTRIDPFADVWAEVQQRLEQEPRLRAVTLFGWLQQRYPGRFPDSRRRTFERRVREWRSLQGPPQEVIFPQVHHPGRLAASDFTSMNSLGVTIAGQPFDHMLFHCTLTYSNWESVTLCFSESFEALSQGLQNAFWEMGGVPGRHRSDSLSAAVNNLSQDREFRSRYQNLMDYYQLEAEKINPRKAQENGDVESSHGHLKRVVDQALLLRGSRDFSSREEYAEFLQQLIDRRNAGRRKKFAEEQAVLKDLPLSRLDHVHRLPGIRVSRSSTIQVKRNTYSVHSRLIGEKVDVVIDVEDVTVLHRGVEVQRMPRLSGSGKHAINYRHVIDSLVRKPGAFENYQYHEDLFPTSHFRIAYDWLCRDHSRRVAVREYLKILQLAARDSQDAVQDALRVAISRNEPISAESVRLAVERHQQPPAATDMNIEPPNLNCFDTLLQHPDMEVERHECPVTEPQPPQLPFCEIEAGGVAETRQPTLRSVAGTASADVPGTLSDEGRTGSSGIAESYRVSGGTDRPGMPGPPHEPHRPADAQLSAAGVEAVGQLQLEASAAAGDEATGKSAGRLVPGPAGKPAVVRPTGFWEVALLICLGGAIGAAGTLHLLHDVQHAGAAPAERQTRLAIAEGTQEALTLRGLDYRRFGLRRTNAAGNGSAVHAAGRTLRTRQRPADEQPGLFQMGTDFQGCHDHRCGHRPPGAPQRHPGTERSQLPPGSRPGFEKQVLINGDEENQETITQLLPGILIVANAEK